MKATTPTGTASPSRLATERRSVEAGGFGLVDLLLFATVVLAWSTAWYALKLQLGVVSPMQSLLMRFGVSAVLMGCLARWNGESLAYDARDHLLLFMTGALLYGISFGAFYLGQEGLPSGLVSVIFSLASLMNLFIARVFFRERIAPTILIGGLVGVAGIVALFWPVVATVASSEGGLGRGTLISIAFDLVATFAFCLGSIFSQRLMSRRPHAAALNTWAMGYGTACFAVAALAEGRPFTFDWSPTFIGSFLWLTLFATVVAYWSYTRLTARIGPARAGYAAVSNPLIALLISTALEGYEWTAVGFLGVIFVVAGNIIVLRR